MNASEQVLTTELVGADKVVLTVNVLEMLDRITRVGTLTIDTDCTHVFAILNNGERSISVRSPLGSSGNALLEVIMELYNRRNEVK